MSVGVPGAYRYMSTSGRYSPELIAVMLPVVWDLAPWTTREPPVNRCRRGAGKCTHNCEEDQFDEGCSVDGDHRVCEHRHGGHSQCGKCVCVDPVGRRATNVRDPDAHVIALDLKRAWFRAPVGGAIRSALRLRHYHGMNQTEIALEQGVSQKTVSLRLRAGELAIADYLNGVNRD